jgi:folate-binding protein YgfZ
MTEMVTAASPTATPLTALLSSEERRLDLEAYRGALTPIRLDAPANETAALLAGTAVHDLGWLRRVEVTGEDRFRWLSGMVTNMVNDLPVNDGAWNLVLNAQGRIQGDLTVWREPRTAASSESVTAAGDTNRDDDSIELEIAADQYDRLLAHLDHFIIMDDVQLSGVDFNLETALGLTGPRAAEVVAKMGFPVLTEPMTATRAFWNGVDLRIRRGFGTLAEHYAIWVPVESVSALWNALAEAGATSVGSEALETFRIAEGIPAYGIDMVEKDLPQETSQMRTLSFSKGCYLGQEIVERIRSRGNVHRHLRSLELEGPLPAPGTALMTAGNAAGHITSASELILASGPRIFAMGMIRSEAELRNEPLNYAVGEATGIARILATPPTFDGKG